MTTADPAIGADEPTTDSALSAMPRWLVGIDSLAVRLTDRINPILVKETRQSLKSRQFSLTFMVLLVVVWGWSLLGLVLEPAMQYAVGGPNMLSGYVSILEFALIIIVPVVAYRSLSGEREDGTYELMSITNLSPRQIIAGKLGSAVLQILVYMSAISPCIAFTYLLRGVDILLIALMLLFTFLASVLLSTGTLVLATVAKERHWQSVIMLLVLIGLLGAYGNAMALTVASVQQFAALPFDSLDFWAGMVAVVMISGGFFVLLFEAAASRLAFASENRSTSLRIVMLVQHALAIGWGCYLWIAVSDEAALLFPVFFCIIYWSVMGILMSGESNVMSARVKRSLPESFLGRVLFTLFNPGPGTGTLFAIASMASVVMLVYVAQIASHIFSSVDPVPWQIPLLTLLMFCYMVIYLGLGRIVTAGFSRLLGFNNPGLALLVNILLLLVGTLGPIVVQFTMVEFGRASFGYSPLQISNPFWTLTDLFNRSGWTQSSLFGMALIPAMLVIGAASMMVLHIRMSLSEIRFVRIATPSRVTEEQLTLHPAKAPPPPEKISPWDDD